MLVKGARPRWDLSLPTLTIFLARPAKRHGGFGLVYHLLPGPGSGFGPAEYMLYQSLPPGHMNRT